LRRRSITLMATSTPRSINPNNAISSVIGPTSFRTTNSGNEKREQTPPRCLRAPLGAHHRHGFPFHIYIIIATSPLSIFSLLSNK
jgi:hypothetical protein